MIISLRKEEIKILKGLNLTEEAKSYLKAYQFYIMKAEETRNNNVLSFFEYIEKFPLETVQELVEVCNL